jgi:threonine dehydratase
VIVLPNPIPLKDIRAAATRLHGLAVRTPVHRLPTDGGRTLWLKQEPLQPIGSFKIRGAGNAIAAADPATLARGVWTASAGNMAQGVAWCAKERGIPCAVVVPDHAPAAKTDVVERLGAQIVRVPFAEWWQVLVERDHPGMTGLFVHPVSDPAVIAGNGTIGLELLEEVPDLDAVVVPYGGGGLSCGIASAIKALRPNVKVFAAEVETAAPLARSLAAHAPVTIDYTPSFVDGIGGRSVLQEIWPLASRLLDGSIVVSLREVADALRLVLARTRVLAEGAGAAAVAAGSRLGEDVGTIVCVVSGGNIDLDRVAGILGGTIL